jgi:hemolysin III
LVFLILQAVNGGRVGSLPVVIIYGATMLFLFSFSALHHALRQPRLKHIFLALDHCGIYLLIAGTYSPFCLLMPAGQQWVSLAIVWALAAIGVSVQSVAFLTKHSDGYEKISFVFYLAMGWIPILLAGDHVFKVLAPAGVTLLIAGGVTYSIGVIFYLWKGLPYGHAVWHVFVVAASALHFFSILYYVVPAAV